MERKKLPAVDIIIGAVAVGIGLFLVFLYLVMRQPGARVVVSIDGRGIASYDLTDTVDVIVQDLVTDSSTEIVGRNRLIIRDGEARIEEADCPDKLCVHQGRISHTNESIVCLPHRISVRITGETEAAPDAVTK